MLCLHISCRDGLLNLKQWREHGWLSAEVETGVHCPARSACGQAGVLPNHCGTCTLCQATSAPLLSLLSWTKCQPVKL